MTDHGSGGTATLLIVDMANVVGSVPDGWWNDRAAAAQRLLISLAQVTGRTVQGPDGAALRLARIVAVLEGRANQAVWPEGDPAGGPHGTDQADRGQTFTVVRSTGSGDDAVAALSVELVSTTDLLLVVTADRGLRARLPAKARTTGPGWLNALLGRR